MSSVVKFESDSRQGVYSKEYHNYCAENGIALEYGSVGDFVEDQPESEFADMTRQSFRLSANEAFVVDGIDLELQIAQSRAWKARSDKGRGMSFLASVEYGRQSAIDSRKAAKAEMQAHLSRKALRRMRKAA